MEFVRLGRSGLKISGPCHGTVNFGTAWGIGVEAAGARLIIDAFLDAGHNMIDTANNCGLSRLHLTRALDASLRRLGTDYVDLYQCHNWDPDTPIDETMSTLDGFVRSGKVRYIGCSNFTAAHIVEAQWAAARVGGTSFISLQSQYSLLARDIEAEIVPTATRHGLGVLAWSPLGGGILAGRYRSGAEPRPGTRLSRVMATGRPGAREWARAQLKDRNLAVAAEVGRVAASWAARRRRWRWPGVASVVIGPRTLTQLRQNLAGIDLELPEQLRARLEEASGPAPKPVTGSSGLRWLRNPPAAG